MYSSTAAQKYSSPSFESGYSPVTIFPTFLNPASPSCAFRYVHAFCAAARHLAAKSASKSLYTTEAFAITAAKSPVAVFDIGDIKSCAVSSTARTVSGNTSHVTLWYTPPDTASCILSIQSSSYLASSRISGTPFPLSGIPIESSFVTSGTSWYERRRS